MKDDNYKTKTCNHHPETCSCRDDVTDIKTAGRPKGVTKIKRTYTIDKELVEKNKITSKLVNGLLKEEFKNK